MTRLLILIVASFEAEQINLSIFSALFSIIGYSPRFLEKYEIICSSDKVICSKAITCFGMFEYALILHLSERSSINILINNLFSQQKSPSSEYPRRVTVVMNMYYSAESSIYIWSVSLKSSSLGRFRLMEDARSSIAFNLRSSSGWT